MPHIYFCSTCRKMMPGLLLINPHLLPGNAKQSQEISRIRPNPILWRRLAWRQRSLAKKREQFFLGNTLSSVMVNNLEAALSDKESHCGSKIRQKTQLHTHIHTYTERGRHKNLRGSSCISIKFFLKNIKENKNQKTNKYYEPPWQAHRKGWCGNYNQSDSGPATRGKHREGRREIWSLTMHTFFSRTKGCICETCGMWLWSHANKDRSNSKIKIEIELKHPKEQSSRG